MQQEKRLRTTSDFAAIRAKGRAIHSPLLTLSWLTKVDQKPRFGFITGKRIGNAVVRNRTKRRLRAIIEKYQMTIAEGYDIVVIAHVSAATCPFILLEEDVVKLLRRAKLIKVT